MNSSCWIKCCSLPLRRVAGLLATVGMVAALAAIPSWAQEQRMTAGVNYPTAVNVDDTGVAVNLSFGNTSLTGGAVTSITIRMTSLLHQVSCNTTPAPGTPCGTSVGDFQDPPVFTPNPLTGTGALDCAGTTWTIAPTGTPGRYSFTPNVNIDLTINQNCRVDFTVDVEHVPTVDASDITDGVQTAQDVTVGGVVVATNNGSLVGLTAGAAANDITTVEFNCAVEVDKQISCTGEVTDLIDQGFNDETIQTCVGWSDSDGDQSEDTPEPLLARWVAQNTGDVPIARCRLVDSNGELIPTTVDVDESLIPVGGSAAIIHEVSTVCSETLDTAENGENTATLVCDCVPTEGLTVEDGATSTDTAGFECQAPGLEISKVCEPIAGTPDFDVTVTVTNTSADAGLANCVATDEYFLNSVACGTPGDGTTLPLTPGTPFNLSPGDNVELSATLADPALESETCNAAAVTCESADTQELKTLLSDTEAACVPEDEEEGCFTRTPGYWGTHPTQTQFVLDLDGAGLEVCGVDLTTSDAGVDQSATEDICFSGKDFKNNNTSPQQLQLIRQCTAAALNLAISGDADLSCEGAFPDITEEFNRCCTIGEAEEDDPETPLDESAPVCNQGASAQEISGSGCIEFLDAFNNSSADEGDDFEDVGLENSKAEPGECQEANGNGLVNSGRVDISPSVFSVPQPKPGNGKNK